MRERYGERDTGSWDEPTRVTREVVGGIGEFDAPRRTRVGSAGGVVHSQLAHGARRAPDTAVRAGAVAVARRASEIPRVVFEKPVGGGERGGIGTTALRGDGGSKAFSGRT